MSPHERVELARLAYVQAIVGARARSSPWTWGRLLTAARNVRAAIREQERAHPCRQVATPTVLPAAGSLGPERSHVGGTILDLTRARHRQTERERARALLERSRRLIGESCAVLLRARRAAAALFPMWGAHDPEDHVPSSTGP